MRKPRKDGSALSRWAVWAGNRPGRVVLMALGITALLTIGAALLEMEMTFFSIMPQDSSQVRDIERITEEFPFASSIVVVVDGRKLPEKEATDSVTAVIDELTEVLQTPEFESAVAGVYGRFDTDFFAGHGFMLADPDVLERMNLLYDDVDLVPFLSSLNDDLEREYSGDGEAMEDDETQLVSWVTGIDALLSGLAGSLEGGAAVPSETEAALDAYLIGDPYYLSRNRDMGMMFVKPTYTVNDLGPLVTETERIDEAVKEVAASHGLEAGLTGFIVVGKDEMVTSEQGFAVSMFIALILILVLMIMVFRIPSTPLIIGIPLILGIYWTAGMTGFLLQRLNILTAMYLVALVGLGVDYAIHLMTGYVQERDAGRSFDEALADSFARSARGVVTGALTTAAAFYALLMADSQVIRELAVVAGTGILCELAAMFLLVPALLGFRNRRQEKRGRRRSRPERKVRIRSDFAGRLGSVISRRPGTFAVILLVVGASVIAFAPGVELEDNLMNMEAKGLESVELQDTLVEEFGAAPDVLYLIVDNEDLPGLPVKVDALDDLDSVKYVDALTNWMPTAGQLRERRPLVRELREATAPPEASFESRTPDPRLLLDELYRLEANLVEMGDLAVLGGMDRAAHALNRATGLDMDGTKVTESSFDRLFTVLEDIDDPEAELQAAGAAAEWQDVFTPMLRSRVHAMASTEEITPEMLPPSTRDTFLSEDGLSSLVTISPRQNPWEGRYRNVFTAQVETVTDRGTGMILAADQLIAIATTDTVSSLIAALVAVFIILLADFRNLRLVLLTFLPLAMAFGTLFGIMALTGIKFDFVNIIAIPLLVGIGIDNSVHINHRYLAEGRGGMSRAIARTGSAVALTTITTMIGFASFIPSVMRAMRSTGIVLTLAMALAFIYSVLLHPAVLMIVSEKFGWNLAPRILSKEKKNHENQ